MNIKVNVVCNIAKNSLCVPTGPYASICVIFFMRCNIFIYCKLPFHRTLQMQLYSTCTIMSISYRPSHLSVSDRLVYSSCLILPTVLQTDRQQQTDHSQHCNTHINSKHTTSTAAYAFRLPPQQKSVPHAVFACHGLTSDMSALFCCCCWSCGVSTDCPKWCWPMTLQLPLLQHIIFEL